MQIDGVWALGLVGMQIGFGTYTGWLRRVRQGLIYVDADGERITTTSSRSIAISRWLLRVHSIWARGVFVVGLSRGCVPRNGSIISRL
jgi:hypothetical protein